MAKKQIEPRRSGFNRPLSEIPGLLTRINKRIEEITALDPTKLTQRWDPSFKGVEDRTNQALMDIFGADSDEYHRFAVVLDMAPLNLAHEIPRERWVQGYKDGIAKAIENLKSVKQLFEERLSESSGQDDNVQPDHTSPTGRKVFIIHGHDEGAKQEVARFLERLDLKPVILHEQPNQGLTIIEKLEKHVPEARFAIVLLTADDFGYPTNRQDLGKPRARQNVILEHGIFLGNLGRSHVVALVKGDVEIPSDLKGVLYSPMDAGGAWKVAVAREIKDAGIEVDLNRLA